jgi:hypothetical protein
MGIIRKVPAFVLQGNFCRNDTCLDFYFQEIGTFYCFESNCYCLANKITEESPEGTLLVYYTQNSHTHFEGLKRLMRISFEGHFKQSYYMHAFKK